ncbi:MAG: hypothetical protein QGI70_08300, partial [Paracoccaceae bacterium]|nr:hypothetical protein [Paracoccaceae bacterium]
LRFLRNLFRLTIWPDMMISTIATTLQPFDSLLQRFALLLLQNKVAQHAKSADQVRAAKSIGPKSSQNT